jgi:DNA polymerase
MADDSEKLIADARQWVEQEKAWDETLYATTDKGTSADQRIGEPAKQQEIKATVPSARDLARNDIPPTRRTAETPTRGADPKKATALKALYDKYRTCTRCALGTTRLKFVFGVGSPDAEVMFIGEGPGYEEDHRGEPFVGRAGQLLDRMLESIGLSRRVVYIANIVKCHAMINPQNPEMRGNDRPPAPFEVETCSPILQQQVAVIQPRVIVTLGAPATRALLGTSEGITKIRGRFFPLPAAFFKIQMVDLFRTETEDFAGFGPDEISRLTAIRVLPMYHTAALLRNPNLKADAWTDMKLLRDTLQNR